MLNNGLQVILQPDSAASTVSVELWIRGGMSIEQPHEHGLVHFLEHVTPWSPMDSITYTQFFNLRVNSNAQVRKDYIRYYLEFQPNGLEVALKSMAGRMKAGANRITEQTVETERKRVLDEIERNSIDPIWSTLGGLVIDHHVFGAQHPYGHGVYGSLENNKQFTIEQLRAIYNQIFHPNNAILFVVGDFNINQTKAFIDVHFQDLIAPETNRTTTFTKPNLTHKVISMHAPNAKDTLNTMVFAWLSPAYQSEEHDALELVTNVLSNRLAKIKEDIKSVAKVKVSLEAFQHAGKFSVITSFSALVDSAAIKRVVQNEINLLQRKGITEKELKEAKKQVVTSVDKKLDRLGFQSSRTELLGEGILFSGDISHYYDRLSRQLKINKKNVKIAAEKWLHDNYLLVLFKGQADNTISYINQ